MTNEPPNTTLEQFFQLIADANLSFGVFHGNGLGAVLLALVALVFVLSPAFKKASLVALFRAWRARK